ncbi:MAG: peptide chain release factor N(5)-glutamine methyltransferase [Chloroflexi bacterium]|nr:peptide chain release factor N(5)-glutamine methyltransferase [Chloroflexota bacterium]
MTPTVGENLRRARATLAELGLEDAPLEAELIVGLALGVDRARLYTSLADEFPSARRELLEDLLQRRLGREPLAYLAGRREFFGLEYQLGPGVFIPRPETESVLEQAIALVSFRFPLGGATIVDVGTGSGAVAVSLAVHIPNCRLYATDISLAALAMAAANAERHAVRDRITLLCGDLLQPVPWPADLVVANLPYVKTSVIPSLAPEISRYEPQEALDGGEDGLDLIRRLLRQAPGRLRSRGAIMLELDPEQMGPASSVVLSIYPNALIRCARDLAGHERVLIIQC